MRSFERGFARFGKILDRDDRAHADIDLQEIVEADGVADGCIGGMIDVHRFRFAVKSRQPA